MMWPVSWKAGFPVHVALLGMWDVQCEVPAHTSALAEIRLWLGVTVNASFLTALFL